MNLEEFRTKLFGMSGLATVEKAFELYSELEAENERLKGENDEILNHCYDGVYEENDRLEKENAKLKCLALHGMSEYFFVLRDDPYHGTEYYNLFFKYSDAYRNAKKELKEGK